jgi:hypothetical protein
MDLDDLWDDDDRYDDENSAESPEETDELKEIYQIEADNQYAVDQMKMLMEQLEQEQALISKKRNHHVYSVNRDILNSKEYHDKFERLPVNRDVQQRLYEEAGRLLEYMDNLPFDKVDQERMIAIDATNGNFIIDNLNREGKNNKTGFTTEEYNKIVEHNGDIILMHNHSDSDIPSGQDLLTYYEYDFVKLSLILGHDSRIYAIYYVSDEFPSVYKDTYDQYLRQLGSETEAKRLATSAIYKYNDSLPNSKKIFIVKKL